MLTSTMTASTTTTTAATPNTTKSSSPTVLADQTQDIPIFLRKTYHMIDTCDPAIACWSDDGETFVVKDPAKFERSIIPQFFKHSKFSSFVRQLNFYAFRKIKYADTIRIDPKLEAETANYWRFRHENFQRGKPELLGEIKRMNGQKQQQAQQQQSKPNIASSSSVVSVSENKKENSNLKSEVSTLKQRIEDMTKNIDQLTTMVQKVTVSAHQSQQQLQQQPVTPPVDSANKRKKVESPVYDLPVPDQMLSSAQITTAMDIDDIVLPPSIPSPMPLEAEFSSTSELSDESFVNHLFTAFKTEDFFDDMEESVDAKKKNRPRPELMERLGDALAMLPRDIQELIVDRLIQAITSPKQIQEHISAVKCLDKVKTDTGGKALLPSPVPQSPEHSEEEEDEEEQDELAKHQQKVGLPLAAATLAALLSQYGGELDSKQSNQAHKTLPVIPVHA